MSKVKRPFSNSNSIDDILGTTESSGPGEMGLALDKAVNPKKIKSKESNTSPQYAVMIPLARIKENREIQPRLSINEGHVQVLANRFSESGQLNSILVRPLEDDSKSFEIIGGHHRYRAALSLGWENIRCDIQRVSFEEAQLLAIDDNDSNLITSDYERGLAYDRILKAGTVKSQGELASRLGISRPRVVQCLSFIHLPPEVKEVLNETPELFSYRVAVELKSLFASYENPEEFQQVLIIVIEGMERLKQGSPVTGLLPWVKSKISGERNTTQKGEVRLITDKLGRTTFKTKLNGNKSVIIEWEEGQKLPPEVIREAILKTLQNLVESPSEEASSDEA